MNNCELQLPATGTSSGVITIVAVALVLLGTALVVGGRRRAGVVAAIALIGLAFVAAVPRAAHAADDCTTPSTVPVTVPVTQPPAVTTEPPVMTTVVTTSTTTTSPTQPTAPPVTFIDTVPPPDNSNY